jgi:hypothetical protein
MNACEALAGAEDPHAAMLGCGVEHVCEHFLTRGVIPREGARALGLECEVQSGYGLLPLKAPWLRVLLRVDPQNPVVPGVAYASVLVYSATWQGERWLLEPTAELPLQRSAVILANPPVLSIEWRQGLLVIADQSSSSRSPFQLTEIEPSKRPDEHEGISVVRALDLGLWAKRAQPGFEAYRIMVHFAFSGVSLFVARKEGQGGVLVGTRGHTSLRWELSPERWQEFRSKAVLTLDAEPSGGRCGRDGYTVQMEAVAEGRFRVIQRACADVGGVLDLLQPYLRKLIGPAPR